jgi:hypothetical protein
MFYSLRVPQPNYIPQTDEQRSGLLARYTPEKLFRAERNFNAAQDLDMSVMEGDLVGVIKQQDPMGSNNRWLIDNGGRPTAPGRRRGERWHLLLGFLGLVGEGRGKKLKTVG